MASLIKNRIDPETGEVTWDWYEQYSRFLKKNYEPREEQNRRLDAISDLLGIMGLADRNKVVVMLNSWDRDDMVALDGVMEVLTALYR